MDRVRHQTEQLVSELRRRIDSGQFAPGQRLPSERSLAEEFGVSRSLIQAAIKHLESTGAVHRLPNCRPTVQKVVRHRRERPPTDKNQIAVWLHPNLEHFGVALILQGIRRALGAAGYTVLIGGPSSEQWPDVHESEAEFLRSIHQDSSTAGVIVWHNGGDQSLPAYQLLIESEIPLVFVDREPPEPLEADVVATNHRRAAKAAVRHLIELGHRDIAMATNGEDVSSIRDRVEGYQAALREAGLPLRDEYLVQLDMSPSHMECEGAEEAMRDLLSLSHPPTAIFAVNDQLALYLHDALTACGAHIPNDISLIGLDWFMRWLPSRGHLTTMSQDFELIGRLAAERVVERIKSGPPHVTRHIYLEAPLVLKETTAPPCSSPELGVVKNP